jgi:hypothetical protein
MINSNKSIDLAKLKDALGAMQPAKPDIELAFEELYPLVKASLERGVTRKAILEKLASFGLVLHSAKFKKLMQVAANAHQNNNMKASAGGDRK